jgi:glycosyltransferase involved in cell wall biosynthesis
MAHPAPRILFIGMPDSPHAARWINQISDLGWDLHFFPVFPQPFHGLMKGITIHRPWIQVPPRHALKLLFSNPLNALNFMKLETESHPNRLPVQAVFPIPVIGPFDRVLYKIATARLGESQVRAPFGYGPQVLARLIRKLKPDLIHSMEFQHAGYNVLRAKEIVGAAKFPKWLATNWGSDIYYYRKFPDHLEQISRLLQNVDYYSCECERDVGLARELGLKAPSLPVLPNSGGFDVGSLLAQRGALLPSNRRLLMVKGYQHFAGRALTALEAIAKCADDLKGFRIVLFSASSQEVREAAEELKAFHGLDISVLTYTTHERMLRYFAHARIYLGVSASDAISTSMLEAMAMGAFPIQTDTSCCDEWIDDGKSGFSIPHDNVDVIADRLRKALTCDNLVDEAARLNWTTVQNRLDQHKLKPQIVRFYEKIFTISGR